MINSNVYDYINLLDKAADASWLRNEAIANNIANATTPNYKRQDVAFEDELRRALGENRYISMDAKVNRLGSRHLAARPFTDHAGYSYRLDGNNVDIETENVQLAQNQIKYDGLMTGINEEFKNLKAVCK